MKQLTYRIFVGDAPYEALTEEEKEEFARKITQRFGEEINKAVANENRTV